MLAEPRRRQKYSINPRGLDWSNDDTKVGQRILEKMGWRKGKSLGLKEDGCKEHVKVSTKSDRKGVGCTRQHADNWITHQQDFNSILSALNKDINIEPSVVTFSLDDKSKNSRSRVHYQKFTKGKDLSGYHSTDLNCIFGERQRNAIYEVESESSSQNGEDNRSFGVPTITSSTNSYSYFATKLANLNRSKTKAISEAASQMANDVRSECDVTFSKHCEQAQQLSAGSSHKNKRQKVKVANDDCCTNEEHLHSSTSLTDSVTKSVALAADCDVMTVKPHKRKRQKINIEDKDCCTDDAHQDSTLLSCDRKSRKRKKQHESDLAEVTVSSVSNDQDGKIKSKKKNRILSTETSHPEHANVLSNNRKKRTHVDFRTR